MVSDGDDTRDGDRRSGPDPDTRSELERIFADRSDNPKAQQEMLRGAYDFLMELIKEEKLLHERSDAKVQVVPNTLTTGVTIVTLLVAIFADSDQRALPAALVAAMSGTSVVMTRYVQRTVSPRREGMEIKDADWYSDQAAKYSGGELEVKDVQELGRQLRALKKITKEKHQAVARALMLTTIITVVLASGVMAVIFILI